LATASASLLSKKLFTNPIDTVQDFAGEIKMVLSCHRERKYMTQKQRHLTNWIPIAIPFDQWHVSPAPFGHPIFGFFPILAPLVLKIYDGMSGFTCPPSYVMGKTKAKEVFPQLSDRDINYCAVFYEAQHNDSRTNLAIAMSAAEHGADISNYVEMIGTIKGEDGKVIGIKSLDRMTNKEFDIYSKKIVFAGGPFTDNLREMEEDDVTQMKPAVNGASGTHIVLPGYYCPKNIGLLDYNTSDGRFLFFVPWENHTLVGTTDTKGPAETLPAPPEDEVQWLLDECGKYLSKDLRVRRSDVLSAWRGWRPLAADPHAPPGTPVSRDHIISENPKTGVIFIAGGKWTTWREMAEDVVDKIVGEQGPKSKTLDLKLFGGKGYSDNLSIQLIQKHGMSNDTAHMLAKTYGDRAWEVCELSEATHLAWPRFGVPLAPNYPYISAEVRYGK
jgi:glycerol-3-phosphate dehydrogenase